MIDLADGSTMVLALLGWAASPWLPPSRMGNKINFRPFASERPASLVLAVYGYESCRSRSNLRLFQLKFAQASHVNP
jgi:hypothetical protein